MAFQELLSRRSEPVWSHRNLLWLWRSADVSVWTPPSSAQWCSAVIISVFLDKNDHSDVFSLHVVHQADQCWQNVLVYSGRYKLQCVWSRRQEDMSQSRVEVISLLTSVPWRHPSACDPLMVAAGFSLWKLDWQLLFLSDFKYVWASPRTRLRSTFAHADCGSFQDFIRFEQVNWPWMSVFLELLSFHCSHALLYIIIHTHMHIITHMHRQVWELNLSIKSSLQWLQL